MLFRSVGGLSPAPARGWGVTPRDSAAGAVCGGTLLLAPRLASVFWLWSRRGGLRGRASLVAGWGGRDEAGQIPIAEKLRE